MNVLHQHITILFSYVITITIVRVVEVFIHEIGHLIAGLILFPGDNLEVHFGSFGDKEKGTFTFRISRATFYVRINPLLFVGGLTVVTTLQRTPIRNIVLFTLGGPLFSLLLSITFGIMALLPIHDFLRLLLIILSLIFILDCFLNLIPFRKRVNSKPARFLSSDGQQLLDIYRASRTKSDIIANFYNPRYWK